MLFLYCHLFSEQNQGDITNYSFVCQSVTKTVPRIISFKVLSVENFIFCKHNSLTRPFKWYHKVILLFYLLLGQTFCFCKVLKFLKLTCVFFNFHQVKCQFILPGTCTCTTTLYINCSFMPYHCPITGTCWSQWVWCTSSLTSCLGRTSWKTWLRCAAGSSTPCGASSSGTTSWPAPRTFCPTAKRRWQRGTYLLCWDVPWGTAPPAGPLPQELPPDLHQERTARLRRGDGKGVSMSR